jgi:hypothetical protein
MIILYVFNLLFSVFVFVYPYWFLQKHFRFPLISIVTVPFILHIPFMIIPTFISPFVLNIFHNPYHNFGLLLSNINGIISILILVYFTKNRNVYLNKIRPIMKLFQIPQNKWNIRRFILLGWIFLLLYLIFFYIMAEHSFGLDNWLDEPRAGYQRHRKGVGHLYAMSITMLSLSTTIMFLYLPRRKIILFLPLYFYFWYIMGSKGMILRIGEIFLIISTLRFSSKYLFKVAPFVLIILFSLILRNFLGLNWDGILETIDRMARYYSHSSNAAIYYEAYFNSAIDLFYGEVWLTNWWSIVPRSFFPNKPDVYGIILVNEHFYPGAAANTNTPAFGGSVGSFADFGIIGVLINSIMNLSLMFKTFSLALIYQSVSNKNWQTNQNYLGLFIIYFSPYYLTFFVFPLNIILTVIIIMCIKVFVQGKIIIN